MNAGAHHAPAASFVVLVAEDSKYDRMILQQAFDEAGSQVTLRFVVDGEELLDYLCHRNAYAGEGSAVTPDVILLDLNMPRMDGNEALRQIRANVALCMLPVVVLSTSDNRRQVVQAHVNGVNAFMTKPGRFEDLLEMVTKFVAFWRDTARLPYSKFLA